MEIHFVRDSNAPATACARPVLFLPSNHYVSTRHDQATCPGCKAVSPF